MNNIQPGDSIANRPSAIHDGAGIRFSLRARHPPTIPGHPQDIVHVPSRVFDAFRERRRILLPGKHRNLRAEAAGRLERMVSQSGKSLMNRRNNRRPFGNLEMIVNQRGLFPRRGG